MSKDITKICAARFPDLDWACSQIEKRFSHCFPWMSLIYLLRGKNENYIVSHALSGIPVMSISRLNNNTARIQGKWVETNLDFFSAKYKARQRREKKVTMEDVALYDDSDSNTTEGHNDIKYISRNAWNIANRQKMTTALKHFESKFDILLTEMRHIDVYDWGFIILTTTPVTILCIRNRVMRMSDHLVQSGDINDSPPGANFSPSAPAEWSPVAEFDGWVRYSVGSIINLPTDEERQQMLCGYWDYTEEYNISDEEIDKILLENHQKKTIDVGQKVSKYLDL